MRFVVPHIKVHLRSELAEHNIATRLYTWPETFGETNLGFCFCFASKN